MMEPRLPSFFIVGAPKCGTTALYSYLREHPAVFMPSAKEPHYFAEDFPLWRFVKDENAYLELFQDALSQEQLLGEASPWYFYSQNAIENIFRRIPKAKIIIMLRDPLEMVYAQYAQNVFNLDEDQASFEQALALEAERKEGRHIPETCRSREMLYYSQIAAYATQLKAALRFCPPEQMHIVLFEQFRENTKEEYEKVLRFLGITSDSRQDFPQVNRNKVRRFSPLATLSERPPQWLVMGAERLRDFFGVEELGLYRIARRLTSRTASRPELSAKARSLLCDYYREEVAELGSLLDQDLSHWCRETSLEERAKEVSP